MKKKLFKMPQIKFEKDEKILWDFKPKLGYFIKVSIFNPVILWGLIFLVAVALLVSIFVGLVSNGSPLADAFKCFYMFILIISPWCILFPLVIIFIAECDPNLYFCVTNKRVIKLDRKSLNDVPIKTIKDVSFYGRPFTKDGNIIFTHKVKAKLYFFDIPNVTKNYTTIALIINNLKGTK